MAHLPVIILLQAGDACTVQHKSFRPDSRCWREQVLVLMCRAGGEQSSVPCAVAKGVRAGKGGAAYALRRGWHRPSCGWHVQLPGLPGLQGG